MASGLAGPDSARGGKGRGREGDDGDKSELHFDKFGWLLGGMVWF